jgi:hypothetical protein
MLSEAAQKAIEALQKVCGEHEPSRECIRPDTLRPSPRPAERELESTAPSTRPATCATSCYEVSQGVWIHHPWDGCRTPMPSAKPAPAPKKEPWPVRCSLCGGVLPGLVEGVEHFRRVHCGHAAALKTSEDLFSAPKGDGDSK